MSHATRPAAAGTLEVLTHHWWSLFVRGAAAMVFGAAVLLAPELTLDTLASLFAAYAALDGAVTLWTGIQERAVGQRWGALLLQGFAGLGAGAMTRLWSHRTLLGLLLLIGAWAIAVGVLQIVAVVRLGRFRRGEFLLALAGAVSAVFGLVIIAAPIAGVTVLGAAIAAYALGAGVLLVALGRRLRSRALAGDPAGRRVTLGDDPEPAADAEPDLAASSSTPPTR